MHEDDTDQKSQSKLETFSQKAVQASTLNNSLHREVLSLLKLPLYVQQEPYIKVMI